MITANLLKYLGKICIIIIHIMLPVRLLAQDWQIDQSKSLIKFSGEHAGIEFNGEFSEISGQIYFDPDNLQESFAKIKINLSKVKVSDKVYQKTLLQEDWFDIKKQPIAFYQTTKISALEQNKYQIEGLLDIRGIKIMQNFVAKIKLDGDKAKMLAKTQIKRLDFDIGKESDALGDWVSLIIPIEINLMAMKSINSLE